MKFSLLFFTYILSFFYILFLTILYFSKSRLENNENKIYKKLIITNIFGIIVQLLCEVLMLFKIELAVLIFTKFLLVYFILWLALFFSYLLEVSDLRKSVIAKINVGTLLVSSVLSLVLPYEMFYGEGVYYTYGLDTEFVYLISILYTSIISIIVFLKRKVIVKKKTIPIYLLILFFVISGLIQYFLPQLTIIVQIETFICMIMYFTIENPDIKMIEQLELAKDSADKANAAKTDFLSSMSHEIRTPLNAIVGFSDCIKHSDTLEEAKENAEDIINASNTLLEIVNGILDISKIEAGKLEIINSDYNAPNLFNGLAKLVTPKMNEKGLDFQVSIAEDLPPTLFGDHANVKKVVTNLLSNAYKYTDSGYVKYEVRCVNNDGICRLIISVEDSGRGIKKEDIDKLFTKFQRVDEDRNTTIEGTGLGLAITKQLIELMGGNIVVHSNYGEGSKFMITLDQRIDNVEVLSKDEEVIENIDLTGKRILVVDDNPVNLKVTFKTLSRFNATVDLCDSGFACMAKITSGEKYDVILMDDMMPKMSGVETLKKLKAMNSFNTPVFALTANAITGMREKYLKEGFDDYLSKPIEKDAVIRALSNILKPEVSSLATAEEDVVVDDSTSISNNVDFLEANGVDVKHGLELLGDMELYNDTMSDFIGEIEKRLPLLAEYKASSDMPNYAILVHAIKSDCKYLGIMTLADLSYQHELKSKENDVEFVNNNYDELINMIEDYVTICKKYLNRD